MNFSNKRIKMTNNEFLELQTKIIKNLKWKPKVTLSKGLEKTFSWYLKNPEYFSKLKKTDITKRLGYKSK